MNLIRISIVSLSAMLSCAALAADVPDADVPLTLETTILGESWCEQIDPDRDCKFRTGQGWLVIEVPGKYHDLWPGGYKMNAPRRLTEVAGYFDVQVRVEVRTKLPEESTTKVRETHVAAGLFIIPSERILFRYEFGLSWQFPGGGAYAAEKIADTGQGSELERTYRGKGQSWTPSRRPRAVWLRFERRDAKVDCMVSVDGKDWVKPPESTQTPDWKDKVKIGVFAASSEPFAPRFDQWKLTRVKAKPK
jgi:hypothetical protein